VLPILFTLVRNLGGDLMPATPGVRRSLHEIQAEYESGDKEALEMLMRAWQGIKELEATDPRSFFMIGGYHGEPFRGEGATNPEWWGGYCEHGTVLFPTWHRAYLYVLEKALQSIEGCENVMLPFWDETSEESREKGLPAALTWEKFELDGKIIDNPLRSFILPVPIEDKVEHDESLYSKPEKYETVRYPLSGLVGTPAEQAATEAHNAKFPDYNKNVELLNENVETWLIRAPEVKGKPIRGGFVQEKFFSSMDAPTYTLFSNTTSMSAYNAQHPSAQIVALESPHNSMHLAIGGFEVPGQGNASPIEGANGDMGENDTAALDPVFYFHHCFIDYAFWTWQRRHNSTGALVIDANDPGAGYSSSNPPPAGRQPGERLDVNSVLNPFKAPNGEPMTSVVVTDIGQLGYSYGPGSLDRFATAQTAAEAERAVAAGSTRSVHVEGLDRSKLRGSFIISAFAEVDGEMQALGHEAVLSRWQITGCANCMAHLDASADFPLPASARASAEGTTDSVHVRVTTRDVVLRSRESGAFAERAPAAEPSFTVEIR
jgi:tyrosinase